jgi:hypothetical protein
MKNQYFGDINDYRKYGLLRVLSNDRRHKIGVCWMLTPDDKRSDGRFIRYLKQADVWRSYDPMLFDHLARSVDIDHVRNVQQAASSMILPFTSFYSKLLTDQPEERRKYFSEMSDKFAKMETVFFDPDNGLEVKSKPSGKKDSSKYLYWNEVIEAFSNGHSILVYQHFGRENRGTFVARIEMAFQSRLKPSAVYSFRTPRVVFFLASQRRHIGHFRRHAERVARIWENQICVCQDGLRLSNGRWNEEY